MLDRRERGIVGEVAIRFDGRFEDGNRIRRTPVVDKSLPEQRRRARRARAIAHLVAARDRIAQQRFCLPDVAAEDGGLPRPLEKLRDLRGVVGDFDRLDQEPHRLVVAAERAGTRSRGPEGDLRLRRQRPAVGIVRRRAIRRQIVRRKRPGQLVLAQRLEEPGRSQVARPTVAPGEGAVCDLADERLDERHLAALGRPRVDVLDEQFPPRERPAQLLHLGSVLPARGREPVDREALPEDGRILDQAPFRAVASASSRAAIRACSVSGTARFVRSPDGT